MLALIDNYDSFAYNLVQYFGELQTEIKVFRNNQISLDELEDLKPDYLVISPGPGSPKESGISCKAIKLFAGRIPIMGVCLGHQCIGEVFGGKVIRAPSPVHGKISRIRHNGEYLFKEVPAEFEAVRYHSLVVDRVSLPADLEVIATEETGLIMGFKHRKFPVYGLQFHPESILTTAGKQVISNFLNIRSKDEANQL